MPRVFEVSLTFMTRIVSNAAATSLADPRAWI